VSGANSNTTYGPKNVDEILIPATLTADRVYTIDDTDAVDGAGLRFVSQSSHLARINDPGGTIILNCSTTTGIANARACELRRVSGSWILFNATA
jgi:ribosomal protein S8